MKYILPLQRMEQVTIDLISFNPQTAYSSFDITFKGFTEIKINICGKTIEDIYKAAKMQINERYIDYYAQQKKGGKKCKN